MSTEAATSKDKYIFTGDDREQYTKGALEISDVNLENPFKTFHQWFDEAKAQKITADAVCLSTAEIPSGRVSSRMVLLKELDDTGFVIYSNFGTSRKSRDLESNNHASLCFWYEKMERSVRVEGTTERLTPAVSQVYFDTRPVGSRIGAWASPQSKHLEDRSELEDLVKSIRTKFSADGKEDSDKSVKIPVPEYWGGLRIIPERIEFWQGRANRQHDRVSLAKKGSRWEAERLAP
ncbi:hypothetical protein BCR37DRAFT_347885 [Protomyces lactucae-debilis]|uniref:pyridoxal 5'-phosphate synthase n=1 Tax=Protomyces lactucae-debilis TaxID=2754530 RepID=A0A1Y2FCE7_PROLT|nr:uncharacterized protein BCR37DRAFT_347885 [Protomyces lactucae-debilis]ORY81599.1 hypothetical protein BCR37DRAFT_347885 [Protomyces lactucae-debilis]